MKRDLFMTMYHLLSKRRSRFIHVQQSMLAVMPSGIIYLVRMGDRDAIFLKYKLCLEDNIE